MPGPTARRRFRLPGTAVIALVACLVLPAAAPANHPEVSLAGSNFEIDTDANFKANDVLPSLDWGNVTDVFQPDTATGPLDESFGNGSKEDTAQPSVVDGGIPPNKSDLKYFGIYQEGGTSSGFLNMFWSRVQDPSGSTNMDFEFNQRQCTPSTPVVPPTDLDCSVNGLTPLRSVDDLLITYDLSNGGTVATLSLRKWNGIAWGAATDLAASNQAAGSINLSTILAEDADGKGAHTPRTFGEAQISLASIFGSTCQSYGSVYLKSRSSDAFDAAMKDFVPPKAVNISNCSALAVEKYIDNDESGTYVAASDNQSLQTGDRSGWTFSVVKVGGGFSCTGTTDASGAMQGCTGLGTLNAGDYTITETGPAAKKIGAGAAFNWFNTDPGPAPAVLPTVISKTITMAPGVDQTVRFGNSCFATATFEVTGILAGTGPMFVRYSTDGGATSADVALTGTGATRTASAANLRRGQTVTWSFGISSAPNDRIAGSTIASLPGYPTCAATATGQFQAATVTAFKYRDVNADGVRQNATEPGQGGFTFQLRNSTGTTILQTTTSTAAGQVSFSDVAPGSYRVYEPTVPTGWRRTEPAGTTNFRAVTVALGDATRNAGVFGNTPLGKVSVSFSSMGKNPGTTQDATKAANITCKDSAAVQVGTTSVANSLAVSNLTLPKSTVTCTVTFVDNP